MLNISAYRAAEIIQGRFTFDDDDNVVGCPNRYMSDLLGSDWASGLDLDNETPVTDFYRIVRKRATKIYGELPF